MSWTGLKKNLEISRESKKKAIEPDNPDIPIKRQCELLGLARSTWYYKSQRSEEKQKQDEKIMRLIDEQFTRTPYYGIRRMTKWLNRQGLGFSVNRKRVGRLMKEMGLITIYPKPRGKYGTGEGHKIYPYLLGGINVERCNQVWCTDITYIRMKKGFVYLVAIMDWHSRYVLSWELCNTLDTSFCIRALEKAFERFGKPEIFNTDQGVQFTSKAFTDRLKEKDIKISMNGKGRAIDNIFIERLWRSLKYEEVYLHDYRNVLEARLNIGKYLKFYNEERLHQSLDYDTPSEVYYGNSKIKEVVNY